MTRAERREVRVVGVDLERVVRRYQRREQRDKEEKRDQPDRDRDTPVLADDAHDRDGRAPERLVLGGDDRGCVAHAYEILGSSHA